MKKTLFLFLLSAFTFPVFSAWYDGGPARTMALGGVGMVLPDSTNVMDLYSQGFTSGLLQRGNANVISISMQSYYFTDVNELTTSHESSPRISNDRDNYLICRITPDDAFTASPGYENVFFNPDYQWPGSDNSGSGSFGYAHSFSGTISAGLRFKYGLLYSSYHRLYDLFSGVNSFIADMDTRTSRLFEYEVDASLKLSGEAVIALSASRETPEFLQEDAAIPALPFAFSNRRFPGILGLGYTGSGTVEDAGNGDRVSYDFDTSWFRINLGLQYVRKGRLEAVFSVGIMPGYSYNMKLDAGNVLPGGYQRNNEDGLGYSALAKCRLYLNDSLIAGISAEAAALDYSYKYDLSGTVLTGRNTEYNSDISAGALYIAGNFKFPAELYAHFNDGRGLFDRYGGIRGGIEWWDGDLLTLRIGANWPAVSETIRAPDTRYDVLQIYEITGGADLVLGPFRIGAGVSYSEQKDRQWDLLMPPDHSDYYYNLLKFGVDLKYIF